MQPSRFPDIDDFSADRGGESIPIRPITPMLLEETAETREAIKGLFSSALGLRDDEYQYRRQRLAEHFPSLIVDHDWKKAIAPMMSKPITDDLIQLPFDTTTFYLNYREDPISVTVRQDPNTHRLVVFSINRTNRHVREEVVDPKPTVPVRAFGETESRVLKRHIVSTRTHYASTYVTAPELEEIKDEIRYICMALESGITSKKPAFEDSAPRQASAEPKGDVYYVLKLTKATTVGTGFTGRKTNIRQRLHIKRSHWRTINGLKKRVKWFFAGDISLGIIVKDYKIDAES